MWIYYFLLNMLVGIVLIGCNSDSDMPFDIPISDKNAIATGMDEDGQIGTRDISSGPELPPDPDYVTSDTVRHAL